MKQVTSHPGPHQGGRGGAQPFSFRRGEMPLRSLKATPCGASERGPAAPAGTTPWGGWMRAAKKYKVRQPVLIPASHSQGKA